jgi:thiamine-phosphate pyrophosphorylase
LDAKLLAWARAAASFGKRQPPGLRRDCLAPFRRPAAGRQFVAAGFHPPAQPHNLLALHRHFPTCPGDPMRHDASCSIPALWLFTDSRRLPDPRGAVAKLPRGRAGVVYRHDDAPERLALGHDLARICRARRLILVVAGDVRLAAALRAGVHLRGGRWPGPVRIRRFVTSSAHNLPDLRRAARAGATLAFLSPVFATASHPRARSLGPTRWSGLACHAPIEVAALGGIDGMSARRLPRALCRAVAAIGALA